MEIQPINLTDVLGVVMGCSIPLVAITGLMVRFALKPLVEAIGRARGAADMAQLERRIAELEARLETGALRARPVLEARVDSIPSNGIRASQP